MKEEEDRESEKNQLCDRPIAAIARANSSCRSCASCLIPFVIPSEVENRAAGEAARWTGRPKAERSGVSESNL